MDAYIGQTLLRIIKGDITAQDTEAIVNAANSTLLGGGGVDGAIHRAGGPKILKECRRIRERQGECPTGQAVITGGGNLPARYVIHTVGPIWSGGKHSEDELLGSAYRNSLALASEHGIRSISFPSISSGAYRFPIKRAARIALRTVRDYVHSGADFAEIRFVLFSEIVWQEFQTAWGEMETIAY
ncbi:MAG: O-acetyl-ADP-ribose deacetylase [Desulfotomaculaceae bacterium]|nr:O-acetyl-ADP-ribose deacetylase [Desulfotomaculaceae bacterium]